MTDRTKFHEDSQDSEYNLFLSQYNVDSHTNWTTQTVLLYQPNKNSLKLCTNNKKKNHLILTSLP